MKRAVRDPKKDTKNRNSRPEMFCKKVFLKISKNIIFYRTSAVAASV